MSNHTTEPMVIEDTGTLIHVGAHHEGVAVTWDVATFWSMQVGHDVALANAHLFKAAPKMLEALESACESLAFARERLGMCGEGDHKDRKADAPDDIGSGNALEAARAAIAEAKGEA